VSNYCQSLWYLLRSEPLLVQGEVDATRLAIAARVDGRVADIPVARGQNLAAGAVLVRIDNPETIAKNEQCCVGAFSFISLLCDRRSSVF
jgi:HlyD family secretion protein